MMMMWVDGLVGLLWNWKKYNKLINNGSMNSIYNEKLKILEDMRVQISDVIVKNEKYLRLYYRFDDAIRNKGNSPYCVQNTVIHFHVYWNWYSKELIKYRIKMRKVFQISREYCEIWRKNSSTEYLQAEELCDIATRRLPQLTLSIED